MRRIRTVHFNFLRNEGHYQFHARVRAIIEAFPDIQKQTAVFLVAYLTSLEKEGLLVDAIRASDYTRQLADADQRIDRTLVGINSTVEAALHHFDPAVVEAAKKLQLVLRTFKNSDSKAYEEEIAAVKRLLVELNSAIYASQVAVVGLSSWVTELAAAVVAFELLFNERNIQYAERPQENIKELRKAVDNGYRQITEHVDAAIIINGAEPYAAFVEQLNAHIAYFNEHSHQHAKHDLQHAAVDEIPAQPFAGKAITPIPVVRYTDSKGAQLELVFAKDFTLTYKDNDRLGTATISIHGKGAYKGVKVVTFNVA
jgi:hypothetical protein